jgi:RNA polymerase sigma factor (sigma-70 family)
MLDFDSIYRRHWPDVLRFSLYLCGNTAEAEDLAATTFLRALTSTSPASLPSIKAYLFVVARNLYRDSLRRIAKHRSHELTDTHSDPHGDPDGRIEQREELAKTLAALQQLREDDREVLSMATFDELPQAEIAAALGVSVSTVKVRIHRARMRLNEILKDPRSES